MGIVLCGGPQSKGEGAEAATESFVNGPWARRRQSSRKQTSMNQLNVFPEYKKYIGLGSLGINPNLH